MNYFQYIDSTYAVKVKEFAPSEGGYKVEGIENDFFILAVFIDNVRVLGVEFNGLDDINMLSVVNDANIVDLNTISENSFLLAYTEFYVITPYKPPLLVQIADSEQNQDNLLRFLKVYDLPQFRKDGLFTSVSWQYDPRVFVVANVSTVQNQTSFYILNYVPYKNSTNLNWPTPYDETPNDIYDGYKNVSSFPVLVNNSIFQFGDYYITINKKTGTYSYGFSYRIIQDIRTNEFRLIIYYLNNSISTTKEFDLASDSCVNGGFKVYDSQFDIEIKVSKIYG
jgi:hypothetical protein